MSSDNSRARSDHPARRGTNHPHQERLGTSERATQERVIDLFKNELGCKYLGDWRANSNIEKGLLADHLKTRDSADQITDALHQLRNEANNHARNRYGNNQDVSRPLRYGAKVKLEARDIDQRLSSIEKTDAWFDTRTRGLNAWQSDVLKPCICLISTSPT